MSKPENALEFRTPCDLAPSSIEYGMELLAAHLTECHGRVDHVYHFVRVHLSAPIYVVQVLQPFGIALMIDPEFRDCDEWSLVVHAFTGGPNAHHVKAEIWSPGA